MSHITEAIAGAFEALKALNGEEVLYIVGSRELPLVAVPGRTQFSQETGHGTVEWQDQDWLILTTDLQEFGCELLPTHSHVIKEACGRYWRLLDESAGTPCWRFNDPQRVVIRAHTKLVRES